MESTVYLLLASVSLAKQESLIMGPYKVSFDLNTTQAHSVNNTIPDIHGETYGGTSFVIYKTKLNNSNNFAWIYLISFNNKMDKNIDTTKSDVEDYLQSLGNYNYNTYYKIIDGQSGILGVRKNFVEDYMFVAEYWPTFNVSGDTNVRIESFYPWDNGTLSLLKTIHVEMVGKPPI